MVERTFFDAESLNRVPFGACVTDSENRIVFWNRGAEALVGHRGQDAVGARCYDVIECRSVGASVPLCARGEGCPADVASQDADAAAPGFFDAGLLCASGQLKNVTCAPLIQRHPAAPGESVKLNFFSERSDKEGAASAGDSRDAVARSPLTPRETEVVSLLADGFDTGEIANELIISAHTVLNHIRNARGKMGAKDRVGLISKAASARWLLRAAP